MRTLYMTGYTGAAGGAQLAREHRDELLAHFSPSYVKRMCAADMTGCAGPGDDLTDTPDGGPTGDMYRTGFADGFYTALWDLCEHFGCGAEVELTAIPILQETIETCNLLDADPYEIDSSGCAFIIYDGSSRDDTGEAASAAYRGAVPIGRLIGERRRVIIHGDHIRYLNRPST